MSHHVNKRMFALGLTSLLLHVVLFGQPKQQVVKTENIKWDGPTVTFDDFKLIAVDSTDCVMTFNEISEKMKASFRLTLVNDSIIAYTEHRDFNLLRIANLNTQEVIELLPVMVNGEKGPMSSISQIMLADNKIWLADWRDYRVGALSADFSSRFESMEFYAMPVKFYRIVPQKGQSYAFMSDFKDNVRVEKLYPDGKTSVISKKFPPVTKTEPLDNMNVQVDMSVAPDMSYFVLATLQWDFLEIYKDGKVKMIRGPIFNETRFVQQGNVFKPFMTSTVHKSFHCLQVSNDRFAVGIADDRLDEPRNTIVPYISTVLVFSATGQPLYRLALQNPVYEFAIDYANNELLTLEDYFQPKLKKYRFELPADDK